MLGGLGTILVIMYILLRKLSPRSWKIKRFPEVFVGIYIVIFIFADTIYYYGTMGTFLTIMAIALVAFIVVILMGYKLHLDETGANNSSKKKDARDQDLEQRRQEQAEREARIRAQSESQSRQRPEYRERQEQKKADNTTDSKRLNGKVEKRYESKSRGDSHFRENAQTIYNIVNDSKEFATLDDFVNPSITAITTKERMTSDSYENLIKQQLKRFDVFVSEVNSKKPLQGYSEFINECYTINKLSNKLERKHLLGKNPTIYQEFEKLIEETKTGEFSRDFNSKYRGRIGEKEVLDNLTKEHGMNRWQIITDLNMRRVYKDKIDNNQMDLVVVNKRGVYIIEVKNYAEGLNINEKGIEENYGGNFAKQLKEHNTTVNASLKNNAFTRQFREKINIESILVNTNETADVTNKSNVNVMNLSDLYAYISDENISADATDALSDTQLHYIVDTLQNNQTNHEQDDEGSLPEFDFYVFREGFQEELSKVSNYYSVLSKIDQAMAK